ncbi:MAG: 16S rRNA (uracil(1498)-N(3))-methyltransferase [Burkholderiales bacterium]
MRFERHRYLAPRVYVEHALAAGELELAEAQAHHAAQVLRLREGEALVLFDGSGGEWRARVAAIGKRSVRVDVGEHDAVERENRLRITLLQGLSSADRMDYTVQKAVELGVAAIQPAACEKSVVRLNDERAASRQAHWRRVAIAACEQCGRNRVPEVHLPLRLAGYRLPAGARGAVLAPDATANFAAMLDGDARDADALVLAVGPEAGFSAAEERALVAAGFQPVKLGERILRTETAGPAALAVLNCLTGEF